MKRIFYILFAAVLTACGPQVYLDYDKEATWPEYKGYQYYKDQDSGLSQLDEKRIIRVMDSVLQSKGYQRTDYNNIYINFYADEVVSDSGNTIGIGLGTGGVGGSIGIPIGGPVINQSITIDVFKAGMDNDMLWQAIVDDDYKESTTPDQKDLYYKRLIESALKKFPPEKE